MIILLSDTRDPIANKQIKSNHMQSQRSDRYSFILAKFFLKKVCKKSY